MPLAKVLLQNMQTTSAVSTNHTGHQNSQLTMPPPGTSVWLEPNILQMLKEHKHCTVGKSVTKTAGIYKYIFRLRENFPKQTK